MLLSVDSCWASESRANDLAAVIVECSGITRGFTFSLDPLLAQSDKLFSRHLLIGLRENWKMYIRHQSSKRIVLRLQKNGLNRFREGLCL